GGPTYTPGGPIGNLRDTNNRIIANQTDLTVRFDTAEISHAVVAGMSFSRESYSQTLGSDYRNADGTTYLLAPQSLFHPHHDFTQPLTLTISGRAISVVQNQAVYAFDTLRFTEQWMLGMGARYEHNRAPYNSWTATPAASLTIAPGPLVAATT